jgi:rhamnopyranosyl-N-acetylglucosaminyl-diphospho-decaprenol beta-1,3/1,4-galactofuranosyltransferase
MEKVIAVVVTYNRKTLLSECITALRNQTRKPEAILVVNNGSTDDTEMWLLSQQDIFSITQKNVGSGGGFNIAINWAYKHGYTWIWCMGDDGYPKQDALEKILEPDMNMLCLRNCAVVNKEDKKTFVWNTKQYATLDDVDCKIISGIGHPFNGTMLNRNIVERVGLPKPKLFLWGDETEYFWRIVKGNNIPVCTIMDSIHYHPAAGFSFKNDWNYYTTWKIYFYIRNRFHIYKSRYNYKLTAFVNYCCFLIALAGIIMVYQKTNKFKKLGFIFWTAADALGNNYEATPQTILARLSANSIASNIVSVTTNLISVFKKATTANV